MNLLSAKTLARRERIIILALCIMAMGRIFLFSAAFPFFNNVDEPAHFDLVYKYSQGHLPRAGVEKYSREAVELIVFHATLEYLHKPEWFADGSFPPPLWTNPKPEESPQFAAIVSDLQYGNHETAQFPVYYAVAGLWCFFGRLLGLDGGGLLYWIRFLNVPLFAGLVWLSYLLALTLFPDNPLKRVGLPLMVAFFPQDIFYGITNDAITPLLFATAFFLLLEVYFGNKSHRYHFLTGLVVAATFLTKVSNITVLVLFGAIVLMKVKKLLYDKQARGYIPRIATILTVTFIPISLWLARNYIVLGDLTGSADKIELLGWNMKSFGECWNHPIFTPSGALFFLGDLLKNFWRGKFLWHFEPIASRPMDFFYIISTAIFPLASGVGLLLGREKAEKRHQVTLALCFGLLVVSVLFLAFLSTLFDFGKCFVPSRKLPYFTAGRLISGAIVPFLIIYLDGLGLIFSRLKNRLNPLVIVTLIVVAITCCELYLSKDVFTSQYNWFHIK